MPIKFVQVPALQLQPEVWKAQPQEMFWQQLKHGVSERASLEKEAEQYQQVQQCLEGLALKVHEMWMIEE
eukprot:569600-Karenia_brevis.AAC.1